MVVTKHLTVHGIEHRTKILKYILNPEKTNDCEYTSDFGMLGEFDWKIYEDMVSIYQWNFEINDERYFKRPEYQNARKLERPISAHHLVQSFSPDDNLTPEEINRIGWETAMELTGGQFRFIVATHVDRDHVHNHILINAIDLASEKKLVWQKKTNRDFMMISDKISKMAGAKIIEPNKFSYTDYQMYKKTNKRYELRQRLVFLLKWSKSLTDFFKNAEALYVKMDFSRKHSRFILTDTDMEKYVRGDKINKKYSYDLDYFKKHFAKKEVLLRLDFLLSHSKNLEELILKATELSLTIRPKKTKIEFSFDQDGEIFVFDSDDLSSKVSYTIDFLTDYFEKVEQTQEAETEHIVQAFEMFEKTKRQFINPEDFSSAYHEEKKQQAEQTLFEVELEEWQIEKEVKDGLYIKVWFGLDSEGLVFIPNTHLESTTNKYGEKIYHIFLDEKKYYYLYNKDYTNPNRFVMGKTMIRQLSGERQKIPHRKFVTTETLNKKLNDINLLMHLGVNEKSHADIKRDLVEKIATKEVKIDTINEKLVTLNQVSELLVAMESDDVDIQRLARLESAKLNIPMTTTLDMVEEQIRELQGELADTVTEYEDIIRQTETFIDLLKRYNDNNVRETSEEKDRGGIDI